MIGLYTGTSKFSVDKILYLSWKTIYVIYKGIIFSVIDLKTNNYFIAKPGTDPYFNGINSILWLKKR